MFLQLVINTLPMTSGMCGQKIAIYTKFLSLLVNSKKQYSLWLYWLKLLLFILSVFYAILSPWSVRISNQNTEEFKQAGSKTVANSRKPQVVINCQSNQCFIVKILLFYSCFFHLHSSSITILSLFPSKTF